jgi:large subunit ribosomal protein L25
MDHFVLHAQPRTAIGKVVDHVRRQRLIPAVMYGHGLKSASLQLDASEFQKIYRQAGSTSLVDLTVADGSPVKVLIQSVQRHPTRQSVLHVDFYQVKMTEKIEAEIELSIEGESPVVKESGGILIRALDKLKVSCLPGDLVPTIAVNIEALKTFEDRIHVKDLALPKGIEPLLGGEEVVISVSKPRSEAELEQLSGEVTENIEGVEVEKKGKTEEEGAEGETAAESTT